MGHGAVPDRFCKICSANTKDKRLKTSLNTTQLSCQDHVDITMHKPFPRSEKEEQSVSISHILPQKSEDARERGMSCLDSV